MKAGQLGRSAVLAGPVVVLLLLAAVTAAPAHAAVPAASSTQASPSTGYSGYSTGDAIYADAANLPAADVAKASLGQAAAGVATAGKLTITDQLSQPILGTSPTGETAYGHGSGLNVGLLQASTAPPQVAESTANAVSPPPQGPVSTNALSLPLAPLATATLLPSSAQANTTSDGACVIGKPISQGSGGVAVASVLTTSGVSVLVTGGAITSSSQTSLVMPVNAAGASVGSGTAALLTQTVERIAPITLFAGTPAALTIKVLDPLRLAAEAGGLPGTSVVSYAFTGVGPTDPVLTISGGGQTSTLTSQQLFGSHGVVLPLGVADVGSGPRLTP